MPDFKSIQDKWQKAWSDAGIFKVKEDKHKKKFYCLEMFPYPSGSFLHMGHVRNYSIGDVIARYKRLKGFNVLYPMGFDSFGLPAENAAKKEKIHPREYTENAIAKIVEYMKQLGLSYDWDRIIASHRPEYYKWNQYFFVKFFEKGLAYRKKASVNFCESCNTVLANEEVDNGKCWRCESIVVNKELDQWFLKTTAYTEELLNDIKKLEWSDKIKSIQENWIGKSHGLMISFKLDDGTDFPIFTTRPDTIYGVTFMVIALNHPRLIGMLHDPYKKNVQDFIKEVEEAELKDDMDFLEKSGVFTGRYVINPLNNEKVPLYAGNFVLSDYATGAIMAVPAHDQRDFEFAKKYNIPIKIVIQNKDHTLKLKDMEKAFIDNGTLVNSVSFNGLNNNEAIEKISEYVEMKALGKKTVQFKLKDWLISRQRYWGTPIPIVYCDKCGIVPLHVEELPLLLPDDVDFSKPGNPILTSNSFINTKCPKCNGEAKRETDTMGGFMDSSWYFLRYCSPKTSDVAFDRETVDYWMPVDQYVGGIEHAVGHLIYSRFFTKALRDMKMLDFDEPFNALFNQGIVYKDGAKMSKSHGNIVTQDDIANKYGIDTARLFMLFVASPDKEMEWNDKGIEGSFRFINKVYKLYDDEFNSMSNNKDKYLVSRKNIFIRDFNKTIDDFKLNTAVVMLMDFVSYLYDVRENCSKKVYHEALNNLAIMLNPFTPHLSEEIYHMLGNNKNRTNLPSKDQDSNNAIFGIKNFELKSEISKTEIFNTDFCSLEKWPEYNEELIDDKLHFMENVFDNTRKDIISILELAKIEKPSEVKLIIADKWKYDLYNEIKNMNSKNVSEITRHLMNTELKKHGQEIMKIVPKIIEKMPEYIIEDEYGFFSENIAELEKIFKCKITLIKEEDCKEAKTKQSMPGKPAIIVS